MTSPEIKPLPCPFCGYVKVTIITDEYAPIPYLGYDGRIENNVTCPQCLAHADLKVWNNRRPSEPNTVPIDEEELADFIGEVGKDGLDGGHFYLNLEIRRLLAKAICNKFTIPASDEKLIHLDADKLWEWYKCNGSIYHDSPKETFDDICRTFGAPPPAKMKFPEKRTVPLAIFSNDGAYRQGFSKGYNDAIDEIRILNGVKDVD